VSGGHRAEPFPEVTDVLRIRRPRIALAILTLLSAALVASLNAQEQQRAEHDWCTLTVPERVAPGAPFDITVAYRNLPDGTHLHCDLKDETHTMMQWRPPRGVSGSGKETFRCTATRPAGVGEVYGLVYASTDGTWATQFRQAATPRIALAEPERPAYRGRSWVAIEPGYARRLREGEECALTVEHCLDESEAVGGDHAFLQLVGLGPWNDETKKHVWYPGINQLARIGTGVGRTTFRFRCPAPKAEDLSGVDGITPAVFICSDEANSWQSKYGLETRGGFVTFAPAEKKLVLATERDGNLFTYDEDIVIKATVRDADGGPRELRYEVYDHRGEVAASGTAPLDAGPAEARVLLRPELRQRGIFLLEAEVPGLDSESISFATIPDLPAITGGRPTRFGMCQLVTAGPRETNERNCRIARRLGLSYSRSWLLWRQVEAAPGQFRWEGWDNAFAAAHEHGIGVNALLFGVPAWAQRHPRGYHWQYDPPEWDAWERFCTDVTERYAGRGLYSVEFWNEPCPDGWWHDSAEALARLHEVGNAAVKSIAPGVVTTMSGGVFPQSQYIALLAAGGGAHVDAVPIHYGNGETVELYRAGLRRFGLDKPIWDNESGRLIAAFGEPRREDIADMTQANWVPRRWTEELAHGCEKIFYFAWMDSGGNWACYYPDGQPRTSVPAFAVFIAKMFEARYRGGFRAGRESTAHLFERRGEPLLVLWSDAGEQVELPVGSRSVVLTDILGNERRVSTEDGRVKLALRGYGSEHRGRTAPSGHVTYLEGADLDVLLALTLAELRPAEAIALRGRDHRLSVALENPYEAGLSGAVQLSMPAGWPEPLPLSFSLGAGQSGRVDCTLRVPSAATVGRHRIDVTVRPERPGLPPCRRTLRLTVITPEMIGNRLTNASFERLEDGSPVGWQTDGLRRRLKEERLFGATNRFLRLEAHGERYVHASQAIEVTPGQKYLYSAWMRARDMGGGSNLYESYADGHTRNLTNMRVFAFSGNPYWELYTKLYEAPEGIETVACVPVAGGEGHAEFDNLRLTTYEGTHYAGECHRVAAPPTIDADLSDWPRRCPIPLLGPAQLRKVQADEDWSPEDLSGVAYLAWDEANLYLAAHVRDDEHTLPSPPREGDAVVLGFDPTFRGSDMGAAAFALYMGQSSEGWHLLVRPEEFGGPGRKTGNLLRDGASADVAVRRVGDATVYEALVPFHYLGALRPGAARKFGFAVGLIDNDGAGPAAVMQWGGGLWDAFDPRLFGCITFVE
jgi:hypothetical protein